ncbi:hypothetical protein J4Q44_G00273910 [Coregonus suidteri]|uniref:Uncharacterized protein n=1 Tax=Coregonus suidteri TaxID=861788 RepID=A0AAN8QL91_9TELE
MADTENCERMSADEEVPMKSIGSQSWSWGLKGIPCIWRFLQNDCQQLPCRALQGWVTRAIWDCLLGEFRHVKATCEDGHEDQEGICSLLLFVRREVCCSAECFKDGGQQRSTGGNPCAEDLHLLLLRRGCCSLATP